LFDDVRFEVYRAKRLLEYEWENDVLLQLLVEARASYYRYGEIPPLDEQDKKSAIYLVRFIYPFACGDASSAVEIEEWHSTRVVPAMGVPDGLKDFELFVCQSKPAHAAVAQVLRAASVHDLDSVVGSSRTCAIPPIVSGDQDGCVGAALKLQQRCTPLALAMVHHYFWKDSVEGHFSCSYMASIAVPKFIATGFTATIKDKQFTPDFIPAHLFLGVSAAEVRLDREVLGRYVYRFPAYFLNIRELLALLGTLAETQRLPLAILEKHLGTKVDLNAMQSKVIFENVKRLGSLLTTRGNIAGTSMTGEELRTLIDKEVHDGPMLHLTAFPLWVESVNRMLDAAGKREE
jgi:hypothetical protein